MYSDNACSSEYGRPHLSNAHARFELEDEYSEPFQPIRDLFGVVDTPDQVTPFNQAKHLIAPTAATGLIAVKFFSNLNPVYAAAMTASSTLMTELVAFATEYILRDNMNYHSYVAIECITQVAITALQAYVMTQLFSVNIATFATYALVTNLTSASVNGLLHLARMIEEQIVGYSEGHPRAAVYELEEDSYIGHE